MVKTGLDTELIVGLGSVLKVALPYLGCLSRNASFTWLASVFDPTKLFPCSHKIKIRLNRLDFKSV